MTVTVTDAQYTESRLRELQGNPLVEALPRRLEPGELAKAVAHRPDFHPDQRAWEDFEREMAARRVPRMIVPTEGYQRFYSKVYSMVVMGYANRNPLREETMRWIYGVAQNQWVPEKTTADTLLVTGLSGAGKSTMLKAILRCFPQVIRHTSYNGAPFKQHQLVYIDVEMPPDASRKALCFAILGAVDKALKTNYVAQYQSPRASVDTLQNAIATICASHCVGAIFIDEFQNLNVALAGGADIILQFFDNLSNKVQIPIIKIGTPATLNLFKTKFRSARRAGSAGIIELSRLEKTSHDWEMLCGVAWRLQWVRNPVDRTSELSELLYDLTQGLPFCLCRLMELANIEAISSGKETIDGTLLKSVYRQQFGLMRHALSQLRKNKTSGYEDLMSAFEMINEGLDDHSINSLINLAKSQKFTGEAAVELKKHLDDALTEHELRPAEKRHLQRLKRNLEEKRQEGNPSQALSDISGLEND